MYRLNATLQIFWCGINASLLFFLVTSKYRYLFRTHQFYLSLAIFIVCFSPVIIWNYHHQWQSFIYQLKTHQHLTQSNPITAIFHSLYYIFLPSLNIMLFPPLLCRLMQQVNEKYKNIPDVVFSSGWLEARMLFFIKNKPLIYTLDCGNNQNQYALWSSSITEKIANEIMFIDNNDRSECLKKYFEACEQLSIQQNVLRIRCFYSSAFPCDGLINSNHQQFNKL